LTRTGLPTLIPAEGNEDSVEVEKVIDVSKQLSQDPKSEELLFRVASPRAVPGADIAKSAKDHRRRSVFQFGCLKWSPTSSGSTDLQQETRSFSRADLITPLHISRPWLRRSDYSNRDSKAGFQAVVPRQRLVQEYAQHVSDTSSRQDTVISWPEDIESDQTFLHVIFHLSSWRHNPRSMSRSTTRLTVYPYLPPRRVTNVN
jgi:hypothetical protein